MKKDKFVLSMPKGTIDYFGDEAKLRKIVKNKLINTFENYGYEPLETSVIEMLDVLTFKGGDEISKEIFQVTDQGKRKLGLRFDQTVPLARFFGLNHNKIKLPYKRYAIGPVFRDGPVSVNQGRYRTFTQCDIDVIGIKGMSAEAEILSLASDIFSNLGLGEVEIKINNRKVLDGILEGVNINVEHRPKIISILDKVDKIGLSGVEEELNLIQTKNKFSDIIDYDIKNLIKAVSLESSNQETYHKLEQIISSNVGLQGLKEVKEVLMYSECLGLDSICFDPCLARGLNYYTGTTFEVYLKNKEIISSAITAGGRYDNMIGQYIGNNIEYPAVGISFGLERLTKIIKENNPYYLEKKELYLVQAGKGWFIKEAFDIAKNLRAQGINTIVDLNESRLKKNLKFANDKKIRYVGIIGETELSQGKITIKDMDEGKEYFVSYGEVNGIIK